MRQIRDGPPLFHIPRMILNLHHPARPELESLLGRSPLARRELNAEEIDDDEDIN
jgi:hypothetical protein